MRQQKKQLLSSLNSNRRPTILYLVFAVSFFSLFLFAIQSSFFSACMSDLNQLTSEIGGFAKLSKSEPLDEDRGTYIPNRVLIANRGLGLTAHIIDHCKLVLKYPEGTNSTWYNAQFKKFEPLEYNYDMCETILLWEQYRNMTTVLTREYLDARPDGWVDYAPQRIAQLGTKKCYNKTLCEEHLNILLPAKPPFRPRQFHTCAVVGNSGDLLKTEFGKEIDSHDAVFRDNEAPVNEKYVKYVGLKRDFRLVVRGAARNMVPILNGSDNEVLIIKSVTHREINAVIKTIPNPVYLFQGIVLRRGAKGTGMKSIELALSMCDIVDMYGFTVDPGYTEWTRYFSAPRKGHNPLQGRAYYQLLECLGVIRIHSPMRSARKQDWSDVPSREMISQAHAAALRLKKSQPASDIGQFGNCKVWGNVEPGKSGPVSGSSDMSDIRKLSNYSKWEVMPFNSLRKEAQDHYMQMQGVTLYKMDGNKLDDLVLLLRAAATAPKQFLCFNKYCKLPEQAKNLNSIDEKLFIVGIKKSQEFQLKKFAVPQFSRFETDRA
uniref:Similar to sialyltransferase-like protein n=1 Tax=Lupinus angustifolius TaxID=3871 RepID=L0P1A9_LUPAN|nr:similar to sialyltransferase-like protein [Lupinus angustifolius]